MKSARLGKSPHISAICAMLATSSAASASDGRMNKTLLRIDPDVRLEQVCDIEVMRRIGGTARFHPDRAKSDIRQHPIHMGDILKAPGAAFRSGGKWYALSFVCRGTPDHLRVLKLTYDIGDVIPEKNWEEFGLWK